MEKRDLPPLNEPTRHKVLYIEGCLREIDELRKEVSDYKERLLAHIEEMEQRIRTHLWVTEDFVEPAASSLEETKHKVEELLTRIQRVREGFEMLPREE